MSSVQSQRSWVLEKTGIFNIKPKVLLVNSELNCKYTDFLHQRFTLYILYIFVIYTSIQYIQKACLLFTSLLIHTQSLLLSLNSLVFYIYFLYFVSHLIQNKAKHARHFLSTVKSLGWAREAELPQWTRAIFGIPLLAKAPDKCGEEQSSVLYTQWHQLQSFTCSFKVNSAPTVRQALC